MPAFVKMNCFACKKELEEVHHLGLVKRIEVLCDACYDLYKPFYIKEAKRIESRSIDKGHEQEVQE